MRLQTQSVTRSKKARFYCADAGAWMRDMAAAGGTGKRWLMDPPRASGFISPATRHSRDVRVWVAGDTRSHSLLIAF